MHNRINEQSKTVKVQLKVGFAGQVWYPGRVVRFGSTSEFLTEPLKACAVKCRLNFMQIRKAISEISNRLMLYKADKPYREKK